jgi:hypothetical protein
MQAIGCGSEKEKIGVLGPVEDFVTMVVNPFNTTS